MSASAGIIIIGNEILSGKVVDINSPYLCKELRYLGVDVQRIVTIPDDADVIGQVTKSFSEDYTWVFTSGGIGPTHDDITVPAIAAGFDVPHEEDASMAQQLRDYYQERLRTEHLRMAIIPTGATLIRNEELPFPQIQFHNIFIFPGIPELLRQRFSAIKERFREAPIFLKELHLGIDEGQVAQLLDTAMEKFPTLLLGSYPAFRKKEYRVKLTLESHDENILQQAHQFFQEHLPKNSILTIG